MSIDELIRKTVREELESWVNSAPAEPELISIKEAAKICSCSRSVMDALVQNAETNGFPAVRLGSRTIVIDKRRLNSWFQNGGLAE